jgi:hypothetical protein
MICPQNDLKEKARMATRRPLIGSDGLQPVNAVNQLEVPGPDSSPAGPVGPVR